MDKAGIVISIVVVIIGVGFAVFSSSFVSDVSESKPTPIKDTSQEMIAEMLVVKKTIEDVKQTAEDAGQIIEKGKQSSEEIIDISKELTTSKLPSRLVSIPKGTAIPGCEEVDKCYNPSSLIIFKGGEIIWRNDDSSVHTVTSGDIINGPDEKFDSGLIKPSKTFSHKFNESGDCLFLHDTSLGKWFSNCQII